MSDLHSENLFRRQAIEALSKKPFGRPISLMPRPWRWATALIVLLALTATLFLGNAEYSRTETVRGWLVSRDGVARITHESASRVDEVLRKTGDFVAAGDPLLVLSRDTFLQDGRNSGDELLSQLGKQDAAITTRIELLRTEEKIELESIASQLGVLEKERDIASRQRQEQQQRVAAASNKLTRLSSVALRGAVTEWELLRQQDELGALQQATSQLRQSEIALVRERERLVARARRVPVETERAIAGLLSQQAQLRQQITEQQSRQRFALKSPISGKLASVEVHAGGTVLPGQLLATVLPENLALAADVYVPSSAIGFIHPGQSVRLMYDAFPQQQFGAFSGKVESISEFVLLSTEIPQTFFVREATFKVRIALQHDEVDLGDTRAGLRPGMLLGAEIVLETRSFADWLLEPLRLRLRDAV